MLCSAAAAAAKSLQSCPTLCDPIDGSPPGSSVHGILQARVLEWGAISFSSAVLGCVQLFATPWTVAHRFPLPMGFPRQEYWSGLSFPSLGDLPNPGLERFPGEGHGNPFQYFCLRNSMDRGARWATVHGVAKSQTRLNTHTHFSP